MISQKVDAEIGGNTVKAASRDNQHAFFDSFFMMLVNHFADVIRFALEGVNTSESELLW